MMHIDARFFCDNSMGGPIIQANHSEKFSRDDTKSLTSICIYTYVASDKVFLLFLRPCNCEPVCDNTKCSSIVVSVK